MKAGNLKKPKSAISKVTKTRKASTGIFAKRIALRCVRTTSIEQVHEGTPVVSKTGDYSDVKIVTPFGEIPWNEAARITDGEMMRFNKEVVNKLFTLFLYLDHQEMPIGRHDFYAPDNWDEAEIDPTIARIFDRANE